MSIRILSRSVQFAGSVALALSILSISVFAVELTENEKAELRNKVEKAVAQSSERGGSDVERYKAAEKTVDDFYRKKIDDSPSYNSRSDTSSGSTSFPFGVVIAVLLIFLGYKALTRSSSKASHADLDKYEKLVNAEIEVKEGDHPLIRKYKKEARSEVEGYFRLSRSDSSMRESVGVLEEGVRRTRQELQDREREVNSKLSNETTEKSTPELLDAFGTRLESMTVADICRETGKTERGIRTYLTRRGISVKDYDGASKKAKQSN